MIKQTEKEIKMKAFPSSNEIRLGDMVSTGHAGMDLRDYFAAKIVGGVTANSNVKDVTDAELAEYVYDLADAMMIEREKTNG